MLAQGNLLQDNRQSGKPIEAKVDVNIEGSPYLFSDPSVILVSSGQTPSFVRFENGRYNVLEERLEYETSGRSFYLDPTIFGEFLLIIGKDTLRFKNGFIERAPLSKKAYFQVLFQAAGSSWVKKHIKTLVTSPDATYGSTKLKMIQDEVLYYVISPTGEWEKFKPSKKFFLKRYPRLETQINTLIRENVLDFSRDEDIRFLVQRLEGKS
jgi:hypothetical protein